jgi:hypothetical protein
MRPSNIQVRSTRRWAIALLALLLPALTACSRERHEDHQGHGSSTSGETR